MATTVSHQRIPRNPRAGIAPQLSKMKIALDQLIPLNNARARVIPSVQGIAEAKRVGQILKQIGDTITGLQLINDAANGVGPNGANSAVQEWAASAMAAPGFTQALAAHIEMLKSAVAQVVANAKTATQPANAAAAANDPANPEDENNEALHAAQEKERKGEGPSGSGMPGSDAIDNSPLGYYGEAELIRDLAAERFMDAQAARKNPAVADSLTPVHLVPAWGSLKWNSSGRTAARQMAKTGNGRLAMLLAEGGENVITGSSAFAFPSAVPAINAYFKE